MPSNAAPALLPTPRAASAWQCWILPSTADVCFLALLLILLFGRPNQFFFLDGDPGWHIRAGQYMLETHSIPRHDIFSFSIPNARWVAWEWGTEVIFAALHTRFGLNGVVFFVALVLALSHALLYSFLRRDGFPFLLAFPWLLFVLLSSSLHWLARPHVISYLFVILFYRRLDQFTREEVAAKRLWVLPLGMILWANLHPGFVAGIVLLFTHLGGAFLSYLGAPIETRSMARRKVLSLGIMTVASLLASCINPYGFGLHIYLLEYFRLVHRLNPINELLSPSFQIPAFQPFLLAIVGLVFLLRYSRYRLRVDECGTLAVWLALALISARNIPIMVLIGAPIYARLSYGLKEPLAFWGRRWDGASKRLRKVAERVEAAISMDRKFDRHLLVLLGVMVLVVGVTQQGYLGGIQVMNFGFPAHTFPLGAIDYLKANLPSGNVFNECLLGGFLIYHFYPYLKVFVDGRMDMYGEAFTRQYVSLINTPPMGTGSDHWKEVFAHYHIGWVIIRPDFTLRYVLEADPEWRRSYMDSQCVIFVSQKTGKGRAP